MPSGERRTAAERNARSAAGPAGSGGQDERLEVGRWEVLEGVAAGEHERAEPVGVVTATSWATRPPVSLPTSTTSSRSRAARNASTIAAMPGSVRSASGRSGSGWPPSGQVGAKQRRPRSPSRVASGPQRGGHRVAVDEHHRAAVRRAGLTS